MTARSIQTRELLARANEEKSGDILAGIAAASEEKRIVAKKALGNLTLEQLKEEPVISRDQDEITAFIEDKLDSIAYEKIKNWTVRELREFILADSPDGTGVAAIRWGLTGEMVSAVTKLMSNLDLICASKKLRVKAKANTTLGEPGILGSRLQPNHPTDSVDGILATIYEGVSYGIGDAVIGINPAYDTADIVARLLDSTADLIEKLSLPTQNCVLSHVTTQIKAIKNGARAGLVFQSIAGTQKGNEAFGINLELLHEAFDLAQNAKLNQGGQYMYFETGQGSELSSGSHNEADQLTLEARCYAYARHFNPFLVNDVVGFIGPEYLADGRQMIRAGLEDHFMGKLLGLPMGIDACYTNHMAADQNDLENLTVLLTASGVNYFMGVPMGDDVMLSYQTTSFHDIASMRELMSLKAAPEFDLWLTEHGLSDNGRLTDKAGDAGYIRDLATRS